MRLIVSSVSGNKFFVNLHAFEYIVTYVHAYRVSVYFCVLCVSACSLQDAEASLEGVEPSAGEFSEKHIRNRGVEEERNNYRHPFV